MKENLVIVESPAKAKTIEKFLGDDFMVRSSFGHIRDLAKKDLGINVSGGFSPQYEVPADKKKLVDELSKLARTKTVWLASDEDREGEAIAWHLTEVLGLPVQTTKRIVFHEITKRAILEAIEQPRTVDMNLVNAQQARRILDRLVGFELSPVLWKKVRPSLSAGRVQSVAVRLLVEREREIIAFRPTPYFRIVAHFYTQEDKTLFKAEFATRYESREEAEKMLQSCIGNHFEVVKSEEKPAQRFPAAPFTTSTLQQEAGRKLGMSVSQTMSVAQHLYEQGLITYMRTDSVNLSKQALAQCKEVIVAQFGEEYSNWHTYKTKSKGAQEAHEAIRPSYIDRQNIEGTPAEKRLYDLIWRRTVASQMKPAEIDRTTVVIESREQKHQFTATGEVIRFDGFLRLTGNDHNEEENNAEGSSAVLPPMQCGDEVTLHQMVATERFTQAPPRYNEASLVKRMEELGIGRPSTYAPTITTIINRGYVVKQNKEGQKRPYVQLSLSAQGKISTKNLSESYGKEKSRLQPTDIGMMVNDYLELQFGPILDYNFTANVEKEFDRIAEGEITWPKMIEEFYGPFHKMVDEAIGAQTNKAAQVRLLGSDPKSGQAVKARIGRYGPMVEIEAKEGEKPRYASLKKGQLIESITLEEALDLFALPRTLGEFEGEELVVGLGRYGAYIRHGKLFTSLEKGDDPYTITLERASELILNQRNRPTATSEPIKSFSEEKDLVIKNGRYGAYIAYAGKNYRIPKGKKAEALTLEECREIIAKSKK